VVGREPLTVGHQRERPHHAATPGVGHHREAEVAGQPVGDRGPGAAVVVGAVDAVVVLRVQPLGVAGVPGDLVHALAELRPLVGHEVGADAGVARRPTRPGVLRAVDPAGGHGDQQPSRVTRVGQHCVHGLTTEAGLPLRAVRVVPEGTDQLEAAATVGGLEQRRGLGACPDDVRLVGAGRHQLPDPAEGDAGVGRKRDRRLVGLVPGGAEVVAGGDAGTEV
jgi:hypothetical protein